MLLNEEQYPEVVPHAADFVPVFQDVISPEILAEVFVDTPIPFPTNPDGSVAISVYTQWLAQAQQDAMKLMEEVSDVVIPCQGGALDDLA